MTTVQKHLTEIKPDQWYRLSQIAEKRWIVNMVGAGSKRYLYRLIEANRLQARDHGLGKKYPLWMVKGDDIINFIRKNYL